MGALIAYLVRRFLGKVLVLAAIGHPSLEAAFGLIGLWLVLAVSHALGFDLFERESDS